MIEVMIRYADDLFGLSLGEFMPSDLDDIVKAVDKWRCSNNEYEAKFVVARFVADNTISTKAYFEIVVENSEADND